MIAKDMKSKSKAKGLGLLWPKGETQGICIYNEQCNNGILASEQKFHRD